MKIFKFLGKLLIVVLVIGDILELLALPALFVAVGLLNHYGVAYYVISIGIYLVVCLSAAIIGNKTEKKFTMFIGRRIRNARNKPKD